MNHQTAPTGIGPTDQGHGGPRCPVHPGAARRHGRAFEPHDDCATSGSHRRAGQNEGLRRRHYGLSARVLLWTFQLIWPLRSPPPCQGRAPMAVGTNIKTYFPRARGMNGNVPIMSAADHGAWLGTDGVRSVRASSTGWRPTCWPIASAWCVWLRALMLHPGVNRARDLRHRLGGAEALPQGRARLRPPDAPGASTAAPTASCPPRPRPGSAICLEEVPMAAPEAGVRLTTTRFHRPILTDAVCDAKAGCL